MERRLAQRFKIHVPIIVEWLDQSKTVRRGVGFTRDASSKGVFAWCEGDCPPFESEIAVALLFPGAGPDAKPWRMRSNGRVVRVVDTPEGKGFAASLEGLGRATGPPWPPIQ